MAIKFNEAKGEAQKKIKSTVINMSKATTQFAW
jgi:hypothetical protein